MSDNRKRYEVDHNGYKLTFLLSDEDAKLRGLTVPAAPKAAPANKATKPAADKK